MAYRPTPRTEERRLAAREAIVRSATSLVAEEGYGGAGVAKVAQRAQVATGSIYRHFASKSELFAEVFRRASQHEVDVTALASAGEDGAPARLARGVETFARRALAGRTLAYALLAEPVDPAVEAERLVFRRAYAAGFAAIVRDGVDAGELPDQDPDFTAAALVGAISEALVGPLSPDVSPDRDEDELVAALVRFCLRSVTDHDQEPVPCP